MLRKNRIDIYTIIIATLMLTACAGKSSVLGTSQPIAQGTYAPVIDPANFVSVIDNPYMPLPPDKTYIYEG